MRETLARTRPRRVHATDNDALRHALEMGVSGTGEIGRGGGLALVAGIAARSGGSLSLRSGTGRVTVYESRKNSRNVPTFPAPSSASPCPNPPRKLPEIEAENTPQYGLDLSTTKRVQSHHMISLTTVRPEPVPEGRVFEVAGGDMGGKLMVTRRTGRAVRESLEETLAAFPKGDGALRGHPGR